jgi:hypothetical protein
VGHGGSAHGFSQYRPIDGRPAEERTEVLVWYSPTALHFGIIAYDRNPGSIRATVADRDNLGNDDTVAIYLDTFDDRRRAFFFGVNPLGIQEDGVQTEGSFNPGRMHGGGTVDRSPDYHFDSKGRLTEEGYVVEVRIPFKSLRYPGGSSQRWGLNILRKVQRTGYEDTWTDVRRVASFLAQSGAIEGLYDLQRGVVTEVQPFVTTSASGARDGASGLFSRQSPDFNPGANLRLGFTSVSIDATVNPDFSQVESDAGLVTVNQRFSLFFAEKRPFFLEGIELFATPNQLVYTRRIAAPVAGGKFTGKFGRTGMAHMTAVDDANGSKAVFNVTRIRRDIGVNSIAGVTFTDRSDSGGFNRVLAGDARLVFSKLYYVQGQLGQSWTDEGVERHSAPVWNMEFDRTAPRWGFNYRLNGIGEAFEARSGFVPRDDIVEFRASNRLTYRGARSAWLETVTAFFGPSRLWRHTGFGREGAIEGNEHVNVSLQFRGGWSGGGNARREFVTFRPGDYDDYGVRGVDGTPEPFIPQDRMDNALGFTLNASTPTFQRMNARLEFQRTEAAIFPEAAEGMETRVSASTNLRPNGSFRIETTATFSSLTRSHDGSEFARTIIPRVKAEYQPRRSLFFRVVAEYRAQRQSALRDPSSGRPLTVAGLPAAADSYNGLRLDLLASFEPTPGTVAFLGYGSSMSCPERFRFNDLRRMQDGFFVKLAYQFRR